MILLDASRSMAWRGAEDRLTKLDYAQRLAAAVGLILLRQRDATGLITFDDAVREIVPARVKTGQWRRLVRGIVAAPVGQGTAAEAALRQVTSLLVRRGLVVLLSDLLVDRGLALTALRYLRHRGHQVVVFHLLDPAERELGGPPEVRFKDPESSASLVVRPRELARAYRETVQREIAAWRGACRRHGIAYHDVTTDQPFGLAEPARMISCIRPCSVWCRYPGPLHLFQRRTPPPAEFSAALLGSGTAQRTPIAAAISVAPGLRTARS
jgi:uncharacterized protein (DUF58 family)